MRSFAAFCRFADVRAELLPDLCRGQHRQGGAPPAASLGPATAVQRARCIVRQVVASLSVSLVLMGFKLSALKRLVQVNQRRTELKECLELLQPKVEEPSL
jgi:hypothetical protein